MTSQRALGILFGMGAGAVWAIEAILGKLLLQSLTFIQVAASEASFATLTASLYILARRERVNVDERGIRHLLVVGLVGTVLAPLAYFFGLQQTLAVNAALIAHLQPLIVAVLGFYFLKEKLHKNDFVGGILIITAAVLITSRTMDNLVSARIGNFGDLMVLFATFCWAIVAIPGKQLTKEVSSIVIVGYRFLISSLVFIPVLLCLGQLAFSSIHQALLGTLVGVGYIFYYEGLRRMKAAHVALAELSSPLFAAVFAWRFLGEVVTSVQVVGALLLMLGLCIMAQEKPSAPSWFNSN